ncbi:MAG: siderophore-iron reductase FhuF [Gemmatimonadota bacterium]
MKRSPSFREELADLFTGELAHARGKIVLSDDSRYFVPAAELVRPSALDEVLARFGEAYGDGDARAVASLWSQWYLGTLVVPSVAAGVLLNRVLPLGLEDVGVAVDEDRGHPVAIRIPHGGRVDPMANAFQRFGPLVRDHLAPFVDSVAPHVGLSPGVLWGSAGRYVQWTLDEIEGGEGGCAGGRRLLEETTWPDGRMNPLHETVRYVAHEGSRVPRRRVCCLRYMLPGVEGCGSLCPLPHVREDSGETP